ncbi:hypothetical protein [Promicromonospora iranensis]|uniref:hypothetical protein n=1 Tax=Promicromonospora iranensis TaxID=1105144 RepID=UPI0023AA146B|nr:hypothetical protein [Promicromonospora iranensis]
MDGEAIIALAGIGGTLVSGIAGVGFGGWLERRAENRREAVMARRAARLIDADLLMAETAARMCIRNKKWWPHDLRLTADGWKEGRDVIASRLLWNDWLAVIVAIQSVGDLQNARDSARKIQIARLTADPDPEAREVFATARAHDLDIAPSAPDIPDDMSALLAPMLADVTAGRRALESLTKQV